MKLLKASSSSNPNSIAGAFVASLRETEKVAIEVVGAGALNQAIKSIAIARGFVAPSGKDLICAPSFSDITISGEKRTGIKLVVESINR